MVASGFKLHRTDLEVDANSFGFAHALHSGLLLLHCILNAATDLFEP
jgi:hypothetical protein